MQDLRRVHVPYEQLPRRLLKKPTSYRLQSETTIHATFFREQKARDSRNPQTGEKMRIPAQKVPTFSAGNSLKESPFKDPETL